MRWVRRTSELRQAAVGHGRKRRCRLCNAAHWPSELRIMMWHASERLSQIYLRGQHPEQDKAETCGIRSILQQNQQVLSVHYGKHRNLRLCLWRPTRRAIVPGSSPSFPPSEPVGVLNTCVLVSVALAVRPQSYHLHSTNQPKVSVRAADVFSTQTTAEVDPFRLRCSHLVESRAARRCEALRRTALYTLIPCACILLIGRAVWLATGTS